MTSREKRLAGNEILFRKVNERILELGDAWDGMLDLVCECSDPSCMGVLKIHVEDYERLRSKSRCFAVLPGHELLEIEDVVERHQYFLVVEKRADLV